jgi:hypothetical protein
LSPITENISVPLTATVTTRSLDTGTYNDEIIVAISGTQAAKIPVTFVVTPPNGAGPPAPPQKTNKEEEKEFEITNFKEQCLKNLKDEPVAAGDFGNHISFGPTIAAKAFNYDLASKQVTFNAGLGAGISMRYYGKVRFYDDKGEETGENYGIRHIRKKCRAETFDGAWLKPDNKKVAPWVSITPIVFASKTERADEIQVQPALTVGFLGELVNVGAGFNLSGPDKGHVFLLLSIGYGFKF